MNRGLKLEYFLARCSRVCFIILPPHHQCIGKPNMAKFADDSGVLVSASKETISRDVHDEITSQLGWYKSANMKPEVNKTEILPFGCILSDIEMGAYKIKPVSSIHFLGITIQNNLKYDLTVEDKRKKIVNAAGSDQCGT